MTRRQLLDLDNALREVAQLPAGPAFTVPVARWRAAIKPLIHEIRERGKVPDDTAKLYADYESARILCAREYAAQDRQGNPITDDGGNFVIVDHGAFEAATEELQQSSSFKAAYDAVIAQRDEWNAWVDEESPELPELTPLPEAALPSGLTAAQVSALLPLLVS